MKQNLFLALISLAFLSFTAGCAPSSARTASTANAEPAATYKSGHGVRLSSTAASLIHLTTAEVSLSAFGAREAIAIPKGALLRTIRGDFVFVENGGWFLRTPIKIGATSEYFYEVLDGLYEGDRIVTSGAQALWLAEIQAVNGGVGCADGH